MGRGAPRGVSRLERSHVTPRGARQRAVRTREQAPVPLRFATSAAARYEAVLACHIVEPVPPEIGKMSHFLSEFSSMKSRRKSLNFRTSFVFLGRLYQPTPN